MIDLTLEERIDGITFAPLNKAALHAGGWRFNDEHQLFAHLTRHQGFFGEMNVLDNLWMSRVTSHVSLRTALDQITPERIDAAITLADRTMRGAGFDAPRIAVAALNPHGGRTASSGARKSRSSRRRLRGPPSVAFGAGAPFLPTPCSSRPLPATTTAY
jgi:4-hydroxythreonine-4-phosphate dehydrogenase